MIKTEKNDEKATPTTLLGTAYREAFDTPFSSDELERLLEKHYNNREREVSVVLRNQKSKRTPKVTSRSETIGAPQKQHGCSAL